MYLRSAALIGCLYTSSNLTDVIHVLTCRSFSGKLVLTVNSDDYEVSFLHSSIIYGRLRLRLLERRCTLSDSEPFPGDVVHTHERTEIQVVPVSCPYMFSLDNCPHAILMPLLFLEGIPCSENAFHPDCFPCLLRTWSGMQSKQLVIISEYMINFNNTFPRQLLKAEASLGFWSL